mgnify:CR=1 FL=1
MRDISCFRCKREEINPWINSPTPRAESGRSLRDAPKSAVRDIAAFPAHSKNGGFKILYSFQRQVGFHRIDKLNAVACLYHSTGLGDCHDARFTDEFAILALHQDSRK